MPGSVVRHSNEIFGPSGVSNVDPTNIFSGVLPEGTGATVQRGYDVTGLISPGVGRPTSFAPAYQDAVRAVNYVNSMVPQYLQQQRSNQINWNPQLAAQWVQPPPMPMQQPLNLTPSTPAPPPNPGGSGYSPSQWLADFSRNTSFLESIARNGQPFNTTPVWDKMIAAQQRGIDRNAAQLGEQFNVSGGRFSTAFGNAATDYYTQTARDQNALLAQLEYASSEAARQRELQASGMLGGMAFQGASQLGSQEFAAEQARMAQALQAAMMLGGGADSALAQLGQYGYGASGQLLNNAMGATGLMFGGANQAAGSMYGSSTNALQNWMNYDSVLRQLGLSGANQLTNNYIQNLLAGNQIGLGQYGVGQSGINNAYQEWLRQQPQYNPLLSYMYQAMQSYPPTTTTQRNTFWDYFSSIAGAGLGALGMYLGNR